MGYTQNQKQKNAKQRKQGLLCQTADYGLLSYFSDTFLFQYDCQSRVLTFTPNAANRFHCKGSKGLCLTVLGDGMEMVHPDDADFLRNLLNEAEENPGRQSQGLNLRFLDKEGTYCWMRCQIQVLLNVMGRPKLIIGKLSDIQEQRLKEQRLIEKASIDSMTGILNREAVDEQIAERLSSTDAGFLFMIDIDNFKVLNDTHGHTAGDEALIHFASEIKRIFRREDLIGRVGGDEFIIFMPDTDLEVTACTKAEQLLSQLARWEQVSLSASIGIACYPRDGRTYASLYKAADAAMYQVKQRGKNGYHISKASGYR